MSRLSLISMSLADFFTASSATAAHPAAQQNAFSPLIIMALFVGVFYFLLIRPQSRKRKEHAQLVSQVAVGDDVVTIGGIVGRVSKLKDDFLEITIAKDTTITMQKSAIANVLPKGTFEA